MANKKKILVKDILFLLNKDVVINVYVQSGYVQLFVSYKDKYKHQSEMEIYKDYEVTKMQIIEHNEISLYIKEIENDQR